jgi:hypothetical protein
MLARRFTIVCLVLATFGVVLAIIVAEATRSGRAWRVGMVVPCDYGSTPYCTPPVTQ